MTVRQLLNAIIANDPGAAKVAAISAAATWAVLDIDTTADLGHIFTEQWDDVGIDWQRFGSYDGRLTIECGNSTIMLNHATLLTMLQPYQDAITRAANHRDSVKMRALCNTICAK